MITMRGCDLRGEDSQNCLCDAPNPGCPLTTRQPAEIYMSHVMRPIHVQKWSLRPTHHTHKMYILYKNDLITICLITKMGLLPRILQNYKIGQLGHFFASKGPYVSHPQVRLRYLKRGSHDGVSNAQ